MCLRESGLRKDQLEKFEPASHPVAKRVRFLPKAQATFGTKSVAPETIRDEAETLAIKLAEFHEVNLPASSIARMLCATWLSRQKWLW